LLAAISLCLAAPAIAATEAFRIPVTTRERLILCSAANFAKALITPVQSDRDDRIRRSAAFTSVIIEAEGADPKALQDEMVMQAGDFAAVLRQNPERARMVIKDCDAILGVGTLYTFLSSGGTS
jgi:hypothetical protein